MLAPQAAPLLEKTSFDPAALSEPPKAAKAIAEFDRFELLGRVSTSARADVFLVRDKLTSNTKSLVALKLLKGACSTGKAELPPLHIHLCDVYEQGQHDGREFIAMEWVDGASLATALQRPSQESGLLDPTVLAAIFAQVARGIERMHQTPATAHAKIDLTHVMLRHDGVVKLLRSASDSSSSFALGKHVEELEACLRSLLVDGARTRKLEVDSMAPHVPLAKAPLTPELEEALCRANARAAVSERTGAKAFAEELEAYVEQSRGGDLSDIVMSFMQATFPDPRAAAPALHTAADLREELATSRAVPSTEHTGMRASSVREKRSAPLWLIPLALAVITATSMWVLLHRDHAPPNPAGATHGSP